MADIKLRQRSPSQLRCGLACAAGGDMATIVGYAHALFHQYEEMSRFSRVDAIAEIRLALNRLSAAVVAVETMMGDEVAAE